MRCKPRLACRESLFLLTYLLFLVNTLVGLIAAIWRVVITALYNIVHLGRVDVSLLHRSAEAYDPGTPRVVSRPHRQGGLIFVLTAAFRYYTHSLKVEVSQSHPVMKAFCGVLLDLMVEGGPVGRRIRDAEEGRDFPKRRWAVPPASVYRFPPALTACSSVVSGIQPNKATSSRRVRSRWQLLYTLVNNPSLLGSRKHFQTLHTSESFLNGTPNHNSKRGSKKDAAEAVRPAETPSVQEESQGDP